MPAEKDEKRIKAALAILPTAKTSIFAGPDFATPSFFKLFRDKAATNVEKEPAATPTKKNQKP